MALSSRNEEAVDTPGETKDILEDLLENIVKDTFKMTKSNLDLIRSSPRIVFQNPI